jgi:light-regulated signal transduction histidine kinase (bacteriophytochrome)
VVRLLRADGEYRWILCSGDPVISEEGEFLGYVGTGVDIHDLKEAQAELTGYAHKLEQSNRELEHFATIASHDLQEPLRKVIMFSDHLRRDMQAVMSPEAADDLERIKRATTRMQRLINDLLDLSRITRLGQPFQKADVKAIVEEVLAELRDAFPDSRKRVELDGNMTIDADPRQIHQVMLQLLDNALKFHKPDQPSSVKIDIQPFNGQCRISVKDDGLGMKAEHLDRIFNAFVRLHHGKDYPGTGIGLALVKKIVERHKGKVTVESVPGEGSTFAVMLPATRKE